MCAMTIPASQVGVLHNSGRGERERDSSKTVEGRMEGEEAGESTINVQYVLQRDLGMV